MSRLIKDAQEKVGATPGALFIKPTKAHLDGFLTKYNKFKFYKKDLHISELAPGIIHDPRFSHWYHFEGLGETEFFDAIKSSFNIPSLQLADLANTYHYPKFEGLKEQLFFLLKTVDFNSKKETVEYSHLGMFVGKDYVLTFSERPTTVFDNVVKRLEEDVGKIRESSEDFLFYALLDAVVDQYLAVTEILGDKVEEIDDQIANESYSKDITKKIHKLRTELLFLSKLFIPIREGIQVMVNHQNDFFEEDLLEYLKDLQDHANQVENTTSLYRSLSDNLLDIYATNIDLRINRFITFLTVFSTLFIPQTFIAGLYGMNFKYMPELYHKYAYPIVLGIMVLIAVFMLLLFRRKRWV